MADISHTPFANAFSRMKKSLNFEYNVTEVFVLKGPIDSNSALIQIMACHVIGT